jgi:hypothetical protein
MVSPLDMMKVNILVNANRVLLSGEPGDVFPEGVLGRDKTNLEKIAGSFIPLLLCGLLLGKSDLKLFTCSNDVLNGSSGVSLEGSLKGLVVSVKCSLLGGKS